LVINIYCRFHMTPVIQAFWLNLQHFWIFILFYYPPKMAGLVLNKYVSLTLFQHKSYQPVLSFCWIFFIFCLLIFKPNYFTGKRIVTNSTINYLKYIYFYSYKILKWKYNWPKICLEITNTLISQIVTESSTISAIKYNRFEMSKPFRISF
jgi:hypothetical protein